MAIHDPAKVITDLALALVLGGDCLPAWFAGCVPAPDAPGAAAQQRVGAGGTLDGCLDRLRAEGFRQQVTYQPAARFWTLQWAELALYLVAAGLLSGACLWWTRSRLS